MAPKGDNVVVSNMKLENLLSMKGGETRSIHDSSIKRSPRCRATKLPESPFVVVDLGCSSGSNTIFVVDAIIKHMTKRYEAAGYESLNSQHSSPTSQATTSTLYFSFSSFSKRRSINLFHSAFSLHWLSQVPESVLDKTSAAYNEGMVFIHGANEHTTNAYKKQFKSDLSSFLRSRSKEMKKCGSMFLVCLGRTSQDPTDQGGAGLLFGTHFQDAWDDLVQEGLISKEKRDNFNIPVYASSVQDFREVIEAEGSFGINKLELFKGGSPLVVNHPDDEAEVGLALANSCRSVAGVLVDAHIGDHLSEELFSRVERRAACHAKETLEQIQFFHIVASLSFTAAT
ncbi:hypothetical protein FNV43_RR04468 [Rhamnella rubrinervis]|uniref:Indole-3-acetate O-methyltransferase 1 n=1 Tax=Rhamnella rubrinervis TaxID=2594499 RepID=A0A8K0HL32_9ROSA|nr:hypothetical protein FNV43_RR04468 [Rhamnella rubrinervis]